MCCFSVFGLFFLEDDGWMDGGQSCVVLCLPANLAKVMGACFAFELIADCGWSSRQE